MDGANYKALDLFGDMRKGIWKEQRERMRSFTEETCNVPTSKEWTT
jgi:hypothetical protein